MFNDLTALDETEIIEFFKEPKLHVQPRVKDTDFPFMVILVYQTDTGPEEIETEFFEKHSDALFYAASKLKTKRPEYTLSVYVGRALVKGFTDWR